MRNKDVADQSISFVTHHDLSRLSDRLEARCKIGLHSDDGVVHPVTASKIANIAISSVYSNPDAKRMLKPGVSPFGIKLGKPMLHFDCHAEASFGVFRIPLGFWIAEKDQYGVANELIDRTTML
jgi:hypothetical protein